MNWRHAGRPRTKEQDRPWTDEELSILAATERSGMVMLAISVVKQWIRDGSPEEDADSVRPWVSIISDSLRDNDARLGGVEVCV